MIDEIHSCDSSRYWDARTYQSRIEDGEEPDRFDKDMIRTWLKERCDPYTAERLPTVTWALIADTFDTYKTVTERITGMATEIAMKNSDINYITDIPAYIGSMIMPKVVSCVIVSADLDPVIRSLRQHGIYVVVATNNDIRQVAKDYSHVLAIIGLNEIVEGIPCLPAPPQIDNLWRLFYHS